MQANFHRSLNLVLKEEGGFVNHPKDPGGMTNLGVTKKAWEEYVGHSVTETDMRSLTPAQVLPFYQEKYWNACRCEKLQSGLDYLIFDIAVNSGTGRAAKFLQSAVGVEIDGAIGARTVAAANKSTIHELIAQISNKRAAFYKSLPTFPTFGKGWLARCERVKSEALEMNHDSRLLG